MEAHAELPGDGLKIEKMPGHWLLARLGKRVLRPGGLELTKQMLNALAIGNEDHVVEFAPGLGVTAQLALEQSPEKYTGIEADPKAAQNVQSYLQGEHQRCVVGRAEETGLPDDSATVIYGEAMLTMQTAGKKVKIIQEAKRLLKQGGCYGIHELCLVPDDLDEETKQTINKSLSDVIHIGARPLTLSEWQALLEEEGFHITAHATAPMHLLEIPRMIQDEGLDGALRIAMNIIKTPAARKRVLAMRRVFRQYQSNLGAVMIVATKG